VDLNQDDELAPKPPALSGSPPTTPDVKHLAIEPLDDRLNGSVAVGLPWPSLLAFVRLATNPVVVRQPVTPAEA
jgi:hypothetical protein